MSKRVMWIISCVFLLFLHLDSILNFLILVLLFEYLNSLRSSRSSGRGCPTPSFLARSFTLLSSPSLSYFRLHIILLYLLIFPLPPPSLRHIRRLENVRRRVSKKAYASGPSLHPPTDCTISQLSSRSPTELLFFLTPISNAKTSRKLTHLAGQTARRFSLRRDSSVGRRKRRSCQSFDPTCQA